MKTYNPLTQISLQLILVIFLVSFFNLKAQETGGSTIQRYIDNFNANTINNKEEKVVLTIDRPAYYSGDTLRFKAHVLLAVTLQREPVEKILYVELKGKNNLSAKRNYKITNGVVNGLFYLSDTIPTGQYKIVAYTRWMLNDFGGSYFEDEVYIYNRHRERTQNEILEIPEKVKDAASGAIDTGMAKSENQKTEKKQKKIAINFYPEGGTFVEGITNIVAFEATNKDGKHVDVGGFVKDDLNNVVTFFKSTKGKGVIMLKPGVGRRYKAFVNGYSSDTFFNLPVADKFGIGLNVTNNFDKDTLFFRISVKSPDVVNHHFYLLGIQNGIIKVALDGDVGEHSIFLVGNKSRFNTGVVNFILLDENMTPRCERLTFINHYNPPEINFEIKDSTFEKRAKIDLGISVKNSDHNPVTGEFSLAITDVSTIPDSLYHSNNIVNYLYLTSDLPGLSDDELSVSMKKDEMSHMLMNLTMLTNGWRKYRWRKIDDVTTSQPNNKIEQKNWIEGVVKRKRNTEKYVPKVSISAFLQGEYNDFYTTKADKKGEFGFNLLDFNDTVNVVVQSINRLNAKSNFVLELKSNLPFINIADNDTLIHIVEDSTGIHCRFDDKYAGGFRLADLKSIHRKALDFKNEMMLIEDTSAILLQEVEINAQKKRSPKEKMNDAYGSPNYIINAEQIAEIQKQKTWLSNAFEIFSYAVSDLSIYFDHRKIDSLLYTGEDTVEDQSPSEDTESAHRFEFETNNAIHYDTYRLPPKLMRISIKGAGSPYIYIFIDGKYIASTNNTGYLDVMRYPYLIYDLLDFVPRAIKSVEIIVDVKENAENMNDVDFVDFARERGRPSIISIYTADGKGIDSNFGKRYQGMQKLKMLGFVREREFYSPAYPDSASKQKGVDHRVTLYWNPSVNLDSTGHASLSFYNSDIADALRVEFAGISSEGVPATKRVTYGRILQSNASDNKDREVAFFDFTGKSFNTNIWESYRKTYKKNNLFVGVVTDKAGDPIPFADIFIKSANIETTANQSGIFAFNKTNTEENDSLFVSDAGGGYAALRVGDILNGNGVIAISPQKIQAENFPMKSLLMGIMQSVKNSKPINRLFEGAYRETIIQDGFIYSLADYRVNLEQYGYMRTEQPHISQVLSGRRFVTPNYRQALKFKPITPLSAETVQLRDPLLDELEIFSSKYKKSMTYSLDGSLYFRNRTVYKLSFRQKKSSVFNLFDGFVLIDAKSMNVLYLYRKTSATARKYQSANTYLENADAPEKVRFIDNEYRNSYRMADGKNITKFQYSCIKLDIDGIPIAYIREFHGYGDVKTKGRLYNDKNPTNSAKQKSLMVKSVIYNPALWRNSTYLMPDFNMFNQAEYLHEITFYRKK